MQQRLDANRGSCGESAWNSGGFRLRLNECEATVAVDRLPGDKCGVVRGKERCHSHQVKRRLVMLEALRLEHRLFLLRRDGRTRDLRINWPRRDRVDASCAGCSRSCMRLSRKRTRSLREIGKA